MRSPAIPYSPAELEFIKVHSAKSRIELTALFNAEFKRTVAVKHIHALCKRKGWKSASDGRFKKGDVPWTAGTKGVVKPNSGNFKKGSIPHNHKPVGHERIDAKDGYILIKIAEPNVFVHKHRLIWEQAFGPIPDGQIVKFKDGNKLNCTLDNLMLISRSDLTVLNRHFDYAGTPDELKPSVLALARIRSSIGRHVRKNKDATAGGDS